MAVLALPLLICWGLTCGSKTKAQSKGLACAAEASLVRSQGLKALTPWEGVEFQRPQAEPEMQRHFQGALLGACKAVVWTA